MATEMNTEVAIPLPPERVWERFMDTARWVELGGVLADPQPDRPWRAGDVRKVRVKPFPSAPASAVDVTVEVCEPFHLRWTSRAPGLSAVRSFRVVPAAEGAVFHNCEHVSGFLPSVLPNAVTRLLVRTHQGFNEAFRASLLG